MIRYAIIALAMMAAAGAIFFAAEPKTELPDATVTITGEIVPRGEDESGQRIWRVRRADGETFGVSSFRSERLAEGDILCIAQAKGTISGQITTTILNTGPCS
ncbi:MAG: hypothetical protein AAGG47_07505 [Pseudomonadota bacterium]